jgi:hypothetical protein
LPQTLHFNHSLCLDKWEFARRLNASAVVAIIPVTKQNELILVEQYRIPIGCYAIELPAGLSSSFLWFVVFNMCLFSLSLFAQDWLETVTMPKTSMR